MRRCKCEFSVEGLNIERFVRIAEERGIRLTDMRRCGERMLIAAADEGVFPILSDTAAMGGWIFKKGKRRGVGLALTAVRQRWVLVAVLTVCIAGMILAAQCMWRITIVNGGIYTADIRAALTEWGIQPPMFRWQVSTAKIQDALQWRYPNVAWVECGWRGTELMIRIVEGHAENDTPQAAVGNNIVATRDGIIESIVTASGTPVVSPGEVVRKGQLLIKGEERTKGGETRPVLADGCVMARVWDIAQVKTSCSGWQTEYTGRSEKDQTVISPWFPFWNLSETDYEQHDATVTTIPLGGIFIPLRLKRETRYEITVHQVPLDFESIVREGSDAAIRKLCQSAGAEESYVDIWVNWSIIDDEILLSEAIGERLMDIAQQENCSGMAATEQENSP